MSSRRELREAQTESLLKGRACVNPTQKGDFYGRCNSRRVAVCPPCARLHQRDYLEIGLSGLTTKLAEDEFYVAVTLTAPGRLSKREMLAWNQAEPDLWKRSLEILRRRFSCEFFAVRELQQRGAVHRHTILRIDTELPVTENLLKRLFHKARVPTAQERVDGVKGKDGSVAWGPQMHFDFLDETSADAAVKYATKSVIYAAKDYTHPGGPQRSEALEKLQQFAWTYQCASDCLPCFGHGDCSSIAYGKRGHRGCVGLATGRRAAERGSCAGCKNPLHQNIMGSAKNINVSKGWSLEGINKTTLETKRQEYATHHANNNNNNNNNKNDSETMPRKEHLANRRARAKLEEQSQDRERRSYEERFEKRRKA